MGTEYICFQRITKKDIYKSMEQVWLYEMSSVFTLNLSLYRTFDKETFEIPNLSPKDLRSIAAELIKAASYHDELPPEIERLY